MQNAGGRVNGRRKATLKSKNFNHSIHANEVDEPQPVALKNNDDEDEVEIRRLTALVVHLRDQVAEMKSRPQSDDNARPCSSAFPSGAFAALAALGLAGAGWVLPARSFYRYQAN